MRYWSASWYNDSTMEHQVIKVQANTEKAAKSIMLMYMRAFNPASCNINDLECFSEDRPESYITAADLQKNGYM